MEFHARQIARPGYWEEFEDLCLDLFRAVWNDPTSQKNGRRGQPQHGTVVTLNCPLHPETENMINEAMLSKKRGAYLVNTARGKLVDPDAIVGALESGQRAGYAGDVW
jgi:hypothetical protein